MTTTTNVHNGNKDDDGEVSSTLLYPTTSKIDMIAVSWLKMTLLDLSGYAAALFGILNDNDGSEGGSGSGGDGGERGEAVHLMGGKLLHHPHRSTFTWRHR